MTNPDRVIPLESLVELGQIRRRLRSDQPVDREMRDHLAGILESVEDLLLILRHSETLAAILEEDET